MKKFIFSITVFAGVFFAGIIHAQTMTYCILNGAASHCPNSIVPPTVAPVILPDENERPINAAYDMQAIRSGYNNTVATAPTTVNGQLYGVDGRASAAQRKAYSGSAGAPIKTVEGPWIASLYPNPVLGTTRIVLNSVTLNPVLVDVVDMNGNMLRSYDFAAGVYNLDVDMSGLSPALYSVRVYGKDIPMQNLKVVKL